MYTFYIIYVFINKKYLYFLLELYNPALLLFWSKLIHFHSTQTIT